MDKHSMFQQESKDPEMNAEVEVQAGESAQVDQDTFCGNNLLRQLMAKEIAEGM